VVPKVQGHACHNCQLVSSSALLHVSLPDCRPAPHQTLQFLPCPVPQQVDPELLATFDKLGIPLNEQKRLANVAVDAVFDSVSIATTFKEELKKARPCCWQRWQSCIYAAGYAGGCCCCCCYPLATRAATCTRPGCRPLTGSGLVTCLPVPPLWPQAGVIFCSISEAVKEYPDLVRKYMGSVVRSSSCLLLPTAAAHEGCTACWPLACRAGICPRSPVIWSLRCRAACPAGPATARTTAGQAAKPVELSATCSLLPPGACGRQLLRGAQLGRLLRRLVCVRAQGRALAHGAVHLLPHQCQRDGAGARRWLQ